MTWKTKDSNVAKRDEEYVMFGNEGFVLKNVKQKGIKSTLQSTLGIHGYRRKLRVELMA